VANISPSNPTIQEYSFGLQRGDAGPSLDCSLKEVAVSILWPPLGFKTPLCLFIEDGRKDAIQVLLDHGASTEAVSSYDTTALWQALARNQYDILEMLLGRGADIKARKSGRLGGETPLFYAVSQHMESTVKLLLHRGASMNAVVHDSRVRWTPVQKAVENGSITIVRLLLDAGASIEKENESGATLLWVAAISNREVVVRLLLAYLPTLPNHQSFQSSWLHMAGRGPPYDGQSLRRHVARRMDTRHQGRADQRAQDNPPAGPHSRRQRRRVPGHGILSVAAAGMVSVSQAPLLRFQMLSVYPLSRPR